DSAENASSRSRAKPHVCAIFSAETPWLKEKSFGAGLAEVGTSRDTLRKNNIAIGTRDQKVVGWKFTGPGSWWGLTHEQKDPAPTQDIVVNWPKPGRAVVYVVSRTIP
ncbi:hypothetical protein ACFVRU_25010, partial [Streptomyces sp. NPDC057927]